MQLGNNLKIKKNKIGILGGSFDPAHKGHLAISKIAAKKLKLKKIFWAITKKNPFKKKSNFDLSTRIQFCKKITKKIKFIEVKCFENKIKSNKTINLINFFSKNKKNEIKQLSIDGFFVAIGHSPATTLFKNKLQMDNDGYIFTEPNSTKTDIEGVFAAGDVTDRLYRQAVTAAGMGCMSAIEAESFLSSRKII